MNADTRCHDTLHIGWASTDITPTMPVQLAGQFHVRVAEGILDPLCVTALALSSGGADLRRAVVLVSCDLVSIADSLATAVRSRVSELEPALDPLCVVLNATHTHTAPEVRSEQDRARLGGGISSCDMDLELPGDDSSAYLDVLASRVAEAVVAAWRNRRPGTLGFGLGQAVIGRNRRMAYADGSSKMYGPTAVKDFAHVEGYEDHSVNLLGTWDASGALTGVVVNVACPSQVSEHLYQVSADYWHDTRVELRQRLGEGLFILPQCSAAGDQSPHVQWGKAAEERMAKLAGRTVRQEIAVRLADAVAAALPQMAKDRRDRVEFAHRVEVLELARRKLSEADVREAMEEAAELRERYRTLLREIQEHPERKERPRWYQDVTFAYRRLKWCEGVKVRWDSEQVQARLPFEVHVLRLGEVALATNPFEYYLDFGIRIKARSPAVQTFLVQLAGVGTYVPSERSVAGRSYGSVPASTPIGPEGGCELAEWTIAALEEAYR